MCNCNSGSARKECSRKVKTSRQRAARQSKRKYRLVSFESNSETVVSLHVTEFQLLPESEGIIDNMSFQLSE